MTYAPVSSAFEGFRLIGRRPVSFLCWCAVLVLTFAVVGLVNLVFGGAFTPGKGARMLRPGADVFTTLLTWADVFVGQTIIICAVYRAVLRPKERAFGYVRLGGGELRVMGVSALLVGFVLLLSVALGLSMTVLTGLLGAIAGQWATVLPGLALLAALVIMGVRLSLAAPIALIERQHSLAGSWELSHKRFWSLLGLWAIVLVVSVLVTVATAILINLILPLRGAASVVVLLATVVMLTLLTVLWGAAAAGAYRGLTARPETPVEVFD